MNQIFISIASHRDPELINTIRDCIDKASNPNRITFGVLDQDETPLNIAMKSVKYRFMHYSLSTGCHEARNYINMFLYSNEDYYLMIDSHMRFIEGWDDKLIKDLENLPEKSVISGFPCRYALGDAYEWYAHKDKLEVQYRNPDKINTNGMVDYELLPSTGNFEKNDIISGAQFFCKRELVSKLVCHERYASHMDQEWYSWKCYEEGYQIYSPPETYVFHLYADDTPEGFRPAMTYPTWIAEKTIIDPDYLEWRKTIIGRNLYSEKDPYSDLRNSKIKLIQIDVNGRCNFGKGTGCWFCPINYHDNPISHVYDMPIDLLRKILINIKEEKGNLIDGELFYLYASHYNEVLLYRHFEEFLQILQEIGMKIMLLTNGTPLAKNKVDLINKYHESIAGICINAPIWTDAETFAKRVNQKERMFDLLVKNVEYLHETVHNPHWVSIQINGHNKESLANKGVNFPDVPEEELEQQYQSAKSRFPKFNVYKQTNLIDRAGIIDDIIDCAPNYRKDLEVEGCLGDNEKKWLYITPKGELTVCCNDFFYDHTFGDFNTQTLQEIWKSDERIEEVQEAYKTLCSTCVSAKRCHG